MATLPLVPFTTHGYPLFTIVDQPIKYHTFLYSVNPFPFITIPQSVNVRDPKCESQCNIVQCMFVVFQHILELFKFYHVFLKLYILTLMMLFPAKHVGFMFLM